MKSLRKAIEKIWVRFVALANCLH